VGPIAVLIRLQESVDAFKTAAACNMLHFAEAELLLHIHLRHTLIHMTHGPIWKGLSASCPLLPQLDRQTAWRYTEKISNVLDRVQTDEKYMI
jgi:hypothetical protein